jgi:hypothetical protein
MAISSIDEIVVYLRDKKGFLYDRYGVTRMGIFGSFVQGGKPLQVILIWLSSLKLAGKIFTVFCS